MMEARLRQYVWPIAAAGLIIYLCAFHVGNTDFWWHIKAGQIMRSGQWIFTDPFAYTRVGEPYLASQSWLAQVTLSSVFDLLGTAGITILRTLIVLVVFGFPVLLAKRHLQIGSALAVLAAVAARPALTDRPQLFTFLFFSIFTVLSLRYLDATEQKRRRILIILPIITLLWSNFHGAAAYVGFCIYGALVLHRLIALYKEKNLHSWECKWLLGMGAILALSTLIAPKGIGNIVYLLDLNRDRSAEFILEWQPGSLVHYIKVTSFFWIVAIASVIYSRKHLLFTAFLLGGMGYLAKTAVRHEVLFLITAISVTMYQIRGQELLKRKISLALPVAVFILLGAVTYIRSYDVNRNDHLFGYGTFAPGRGASEFVQKEGITGNMFNNYNIGGELLYRDHKVFIDGRNLDYGYEYINRTVNAGVDGSIWKGLEREYQFTHAVIYYDLQAEFDPIPYTDLLDTDPLWSLAYMDDWTAVYIKAPTQKAITSITPKTLHNQEIPSEMSVADFRTLESDLYHVIDSRPDGVKARLYLAKLYTSLEGYDQAEQLLNAAVEVQPKNYLVYIGFTKLRMEQGRWEDAWNSIKKAKRAAGFTGVQINEEFVERIRSKI